MPVIISCLPVSEICIIKFKFMQQALSSLHRDHNGIPIIRGAKIQQENVVSRFITWCEKQEKNRMLWLGLAYMGIIGMALPCALTAILFLAGGNFTLIVVAAVINVPVFALNLAAQGTKITLPLFFLALFADVAIILYSLVFFLYN